MNEWILSNFREYFDEYEEDDYDPDAPAFTIKVRRRRYKSTTERYAKGKIPFNLPRYSIGQVLTPAEVVFNFSDGIQSNPATIAGFSLKDDTIGVQLQDRTITYDVNEANVLTIMETWEGAGREEQYDENTGTWSYVNPPAV